MQEKLALRKTIEDRDKALSRYKKEMEQLESHVQRLRKLNTDMAPLTNEELAARADHQEFLECVRILRSAGFDRMAMSDSVSDVIRAFENEMLRSKHLAAVIRRWKKGINKLTSEALDDTENMPGR